jgi:hypothetical protein
MNKDQLLDPAESPVSCDAKAGTHLLTYLSQA